MVRRVKRKLLAWVAMVALPLAAGNKIVVLSVARLLGQAIKSIHEETSVSSLFV